MRHVLALLLPLGCVESTKCPSGYVLDAGSGMCLEEGSDDTAGDTGGDVEDTDTAVDTDTAQDTDTAVDTDTGVDTDTATDTDTDPDPDTDTAADTDTGVDTDPDGDGYTATAGDCDDADATVYPDAPEDDDGVDDDCDGYVDEWEVCATDGDYTSIQDALDDADDLRLILVCAGTYVENLDFGGTDAQVVSRDGPEATVIDGGARYSVVTFATRETADALLYGFTIQNGSGEDSGRTEDYTGGGLHIYDASPTVEGNIITGNSALLGAGVLVFYDLSDPTFLHNIFTANVTTTGGYGGGAYFYTGTNGTLANNLFTENEGGATGGGLVLSAVGDVLVANNTFVGNMAGSERTSYAAADLYLYDRGDAVLRNNIFSYGEGGAAISGSNGATVAECTYNNFWEADNGNLLLVAACTSSTNTSVDCVYTSRAGGDYTLQASSPCIDAGDPDGAYDDPDGTRGDLGAWGGPEGTWP